MNSYTIGLHNTGLMVIQYPIFGFHHGVHGIKHILSIAMDNSQVFKTGEIVGHLSVGSLIGLWNRYSVTVILDYKNNRQFFIRGTVYGLLHITFRNRRFTHRANRDPLVFIFLHGPAHANCMEG